MKKSKGMQLGAMLAAMLLVSMALVPAVAATQATTLSEPTDKKAEAKNVIEKIKQDLNKGGAASEADLETVVGLLEQSTGRTLNQTQKEGLKN